MDGSNLLSGVSWGIGAQAEVDKLQFSNPHFMSPVRCGFFHLSSPLQGGRSGRVSGSAALRAGLLLTLDAGQVERKRLMSHLLAMLTRLPHEMTALVLDLVRMGQGAGRSMEERTGCRSLLAHMDAAPASWR